MAANSSWGGSRQDSETHAGFVLAMTDIGRNDECWHFPRQSVGVTVVCHVMSALRPKCPGSTSQVLQSVVQ